MRKDYKYRVFKGRNTNLQALFGEAILDDNPALDNSVGLG